MPPAPTNPTGGTNYIVAGILAMLAAGVTAIVATTGTITNLIVPEQATPALSASGQARLYADSTAHNVQISQNGGAYASLGGATFANPSVSITGPVANGVAVTAMRSDAVPALGTITQTVTISPSSDIAPITINASGNTPANEFIALNLNNGSHALQFGVDPADPASGLIQAGTGTFNSTNCAIKIFSNELDLYAPGQNAHFIKLINGAGISCDSFSLNNGGLLQIGNGNGGGSFVQAAGNAAVLGCQVATNTWFQNTQARTTVATKVDATTTTLANLTDLSVTLKDGRKYSFMYKLLSTCDVVGGWKCDLSGGAVTATTINAHYNASAAAAVFGSNVTALNTTSGNASAALMIEITGTITVNAGGTLIPRFAQTAANGTSSVLVGSFLVIEDMP